MSEDTIDQLCINTIRALAIDAVQKANSGHPGLPLGAAPMAYVLWHRHLRHNPQDPGWPDRDRFVLSAGHGSALLYALLHLTGYDLTLDDVKAFRQLHSRTPGHPESGQTPGVEAITGPLGQGTANAVGMAIAERFLAHTFNRPNGEIVNHYTYALVGDGDLMEGIAAEAASLAGHLKLGKLIYLYDANNISLDGPISLTFTEDVGKRYQAQGWQVIEVEDGDTDLAAIDDAIAAAKADQQRPSLVIVRTTIGYGSPNKQGTSAVHGSPLGAEELALTKKALGWDPEAHFEVPNEAARHLRSALHRGEEQQAAWRSQLDRLGQAHPELVAQFHEAVAGRLPEGWDASLPSFAPGQALATRKASGQVLNALASKIPTLFGGDADLSVSTNTAIRDGGSFEGQTGAGRNIHYGVREHAMAAIANGIAYHGGARTFTATFFCFADYMRPALRLAALGELPIIHIWTHDSVWLGEDGPTHQPVEQLMSLRAMPNFTVLRPADAVETVQAWKLAIQHRHGPVGLVLTRQGVPVLDRGKAGPGSFEQGGYVVIEASEAAKILLLATGSEVHLAAEASQLLEAEGIATRVVSLPSLDLFAQQNQAYRDTILPPGIKARVAIEAGVSLGWHQWVGDHGACVTIDRFGISAPCKDIVTELGFTAERVADTARSLLQG